MAVIGYITDTDKIDKELLSYTKDIMKELHCERIYEESTTETTERPRLKYIMEEISSGDTLVFHKLSNALSNAVELTILCRICVRKEIRLVSILDKLDTCSEVFKTKPMDIIKLLSTFSLEAYTSKHRSNKLGFVLNSIKLIEKRRQKGIQDITIVNMYMAEYSYNDIMDILGIKSTRTVQRALKKYGIKINRKKYERADITSEHSCKNSRYDNNKTNQKSKTRND